MKQADLGLNLTTKRTRKREFLAEMERGKLGSDHNFLDHNFWQCNMDGQIGL